MLLNALNLNIVRVNIWAKPTDDYLTRPHVTANHVHEIQYADYLEANFYQRMYPLTFVRSVISDNGTSPQFLHHVSNLLNHFPKTSIGKGGTTPWPSSSPEMNPLNLRSS
jgi:hypothetical protein